MTAKSDGSPIENARIVGSPRAIGSRGWQANTDSEGNFDVLRFGGPTHVHVINDDQSLALPWSQSTLRAQIKIQLEPVGSVRGRLMDGQKPVAGQMINYGIQFRSLNGFHFKKRFGGQVTTDSQGIFELDALTPDWEYQLDLPVVFSPKGIIQKITTVTVKAGESKDLGDIAMPAPYEAKAPPTLEERIESAFNAKDTPTIRLKQELAKTRLANQPTLVVFGQPEDPAVRSFMDIRYNDRDFRLVPE